MCLNSLCCAWLGLGVTLSWGFISPSQAQRRGNGMVFLGMARRCWHGFPSNPNMSLQGHLPPARCEPGAVEGAVVCGAVTPGLCFPLCIKCFVSLEPCLHCKVSTVILQHLKAVALMGIFESV